MLHVLASGSSGNSFCMETEQELIFVDMGITKTRVKQFLNSIESSRKEISVLITHEHTDHISGLGVFVKEFNPKIYTSRGTARELMKKNIPCDRVYVLNAHEYYEFDSFAVKPLNISHDAAETFGYIISTASGNTGFMTDLGCITERQLEELYIADTLVLESNHDKEMLDTGPYPRRLKQRVNSAKGHLSNSDAMLALAALCSGNLRRCLLAHVSEKNNDYELLDKLALFASKQYKVETSVLRQKCTYRFNLSPFFYGLRGVCAQQ